MNKETEEQNFSENKNIEVFIGDYIKSTDSTSPNVSEKKKEIKENEKNKKNDKDTNDNKKLVKEIKKEKVKNDVDFDYDSRFFRPKVGFNPWICFICKEDKGRDYPCLVDRYNAVYRRTCRVCKDCVPKRVEALKQAIEEGLDVVKTIEVQEEKKKKEETSELKWGIRRNGENKVEKEIKKSKSLLYSPTKGQGMRSVSKPLPPKTTSSYFNVEESESDDNVDLLNDEGLSSEASYLIGDGNFEEVSEDQLAVPIASALSEKEIYRRLDITMKVAKKFRIFADRTIFYKIIGSKAHFKLIVTGKGIGKTTNPALFQVLYIMLWKEGHFIWVWRNSKDGLRKGKEAWERILKIEMPSKKIPGFDIKHWRDTRGMVATEQGVSYKKTKRVYFTTLANYKDLEGKLLGDAIHYVFDEASPSDGKLAEADGITESSRWSQSWNNVMRVRNWITQCYFLSNPHVKGIWWLEMLLPAKWIEIAFDKLKKGANEEGGENLLDSTDPKWIDDPEVVAFQKLKIEKMDLDFTPYFLLYQAKEWKGKYGSAFNLVENILRHPEGLFSDAEDAWLLEKRPEKYRQRIIFKDCVFCEYKKGRETAYFFYFHEPEEGGELDKNIVHLCITNEEFRQSKIKNKDLPASKAELKEHVSSFSFLLERGRLHFCDPKKYRAKQVILQMIDSLDIKT
jgi:hypothetical protein